MENLPVYVTALFIAITLTVIYVLYRASGNKPIVLLIALAWLALQGSIAGSGFYLFTNTLPPRFALAILPPLVLIALLFITPKGRRFMDSCQQNWLTGLHTIRVAVELVLYFLFVHRYIPGIMTFEGRNFDVLSGLTAPFIWWFGYHKPTLNTKWLLSWNVICLGLVINIVIIAMLSTPFSFQKFGFGQPNVAILHFPYVWLPCFIVPAVIFAHLVCIRQLIRSKVKVKSAKYHPHI